MSEQIKKAEQRVVRACLTRLVRWRKEHPEGLLPKSHVRGIQDYASREVILATIALAELLPSPPPSKRT